MSNDYSMIRISMTDFFRLPDGMRRRNEDGLQVLSTQGGEAVWKPAIII